MKGTSRIVILRSRSLDKVREAMIAGTEQPNPMSMGTKLLPERPRRRSGLSITNATRAMYPLSSRMERNKNNVTMTGKNPSTLPTPPQMPSVTSELTIGLTSAAVSASPMAPITKSMPVCSQSDSQAPSQLNVMRNTNPMMRIKHGMAVKRPVRMRSAATLRACSRLSCGRTMVRAQRRSMNENRMFASAASRSSPP